MSRPVCYYCMQDYPPMLLIVVVYRHYNLVGLLTVSFGWKFLFHLWSAFPPPCFSFATNNSAFYFHGFCSFPNYINQKIGARDVGWEKIPIYLSRSRLPHSVWLFSNSINLLASFLISFFSYSIVHMSTLPLTIII